MVPVPEKKYSCSTYPSGTGGRTEKPSAMNGKLGSLDGVGPGPGGIGTVKGVTSRAGAGRAPTSPAPRATARRGSQRLPGVLDFLPARNPSIAPPLVRKGTAGADPLRSA